MYGELGKKLLEAINEALELARPDIILGEWYELKVNFMAESKKENKIIARHDKAIGMDRNDDLLYHRGKEDADKILNQIIERWYDMVKQANLCKCKREK